MAALSGSASTSRLQRPRGFQFRERSNVRSDWGLLVDERWRKYCKAGPFAGAGHLTLQTSASSSTLMPLPGAALSKGTALDQLLQLEALSGSPTSAGGGSRGSVSPCSTTTKSRNRMRGSVLTSRSRESTLSTPLKRVSVHIPSRLETSSSPLSPNSPTSPNSRSRCSTMSRGSVNPRGSMFASPGRKSVAGGRRGTLALPAAPEADEPETPPPVEINVMEASGEFEKCNGEYICIGEYQGKKKFKNALNAIIYFKDGWKMHMLDNTNAYVFANQSKDADNIPEGEWEAKLAGTEPCIVRKAALRRRWRALRGIVMLMCCFSKFRRVRNEKADLVKTVLRQLGEWARMKHAVGRTLRSVKMMQRGIRRQLMTKQKCCEEMRKMWVKTEDHYLSTYFKEYTARIIEESKQAAKEVQMHGSKKTEKPLDLSDVLSSAGGGKNDFVALSLDWTAWQIPDWKRKAVIGWYYMAGLRRYTKSRIEIERAVKRAVEDYKQLDKFLESFGHKDTERMDVTVLPREPTGKFWDIAQSEGAIALELIARCADELKDVVPFHMHPANIEHHSGASASAARVAAAHLASLKRAAEPQGPQPLDSLASMPDGDVPEMEPDASNARDADEIFEEIMEGAGGAFTPRIKIMEASIGA